MSGRPESVIRRSALDVIDYDDVHGHLPRDQAESELFANRREQGRSILAIVFLVLLGITGGFFFTTLTGNPVSGFGIVTGIYLVLIVLVVVVLKRKIELSVINAMIRQVFNKEKNATDGQHHN